MEQLPDTVRVESNFVYVANFLSLAPAGNATQVINIDSSADFLWIKGAYMADNAGAAQTDSSRIVPNVDVQIQLGGADKNMFSANTPIPSVFGTGQEPFVWSMPQRLYRSSALTITLTSREAAITLNIRLALIGWKDYGELRRNAAA
jgi:hypothetical protein